MGFNRAATIPFHLKVIVAVTDTQQMIQKPFFVIEHMAEILYDCLS